jgi:hypothetical protein
MFIGGVFRVVFVRILYTTIDASVPAKYTKSFIFTAFGPYKYVDWKPK